MNSDQSNLMEEMNNKRKESASDGISEYFQAIQELQERVIQQGHASLIQISQQMAETIQSKGRIFLFGTGHSHMLVEEAYCRAGGLVSVIPIFLSALMVHEDVPLSGLLERTPGLAKPLLDRYNPKPGEMIFIFSNSGVNQLPVEMALYAKECGLSVVSICSLAYSRVAPLSSLGKRLSDISDFTIDNGGISGDSLVPVAETGLYTGPSSTVIGAMLWNCLLTETAFQLHHKFGITPILISGNMPGAAEHNAALLKQWKSDINIEAG